MKIVEYDSYYKVNKQNSFNDANTHNEDIDIDSDEEEFLQELESEILGRKDGSKGLKSEDDYSDSGKVAAAPVASELRFFLYHQIKQINKKSAPLH